MKYLKKFQTLSEYEEFSNSNNYMYPNTSVVKETIDGAAIKYCKPKIETSITATCPSSIKVGKPLTVTVSNIPPDYVGKVYVTINGVTNYVDAINGIAKIIIPDLKIGKYTGIAYFPGDYKYLPSQDDFSFRVINSSPIE